MKARAVQLAKTATKRLLRIGGHALIPPGYLDKYSLGFHLAELFRQRRVDCVLDVGAHYGGYYRFLRDEVGFRGLVISFDPVKKHAGALRQQAKNDRHWVIYNVALGAAAGERPINVMHQSGFTSFLEPDNSRVPDFAEMNRVVDRETVRIETLDSMMAALCELHRMRRPYLKLDTQGFDLEVIRGARESLPRIVALQTEVSMRPIYHTMPGFLEAYATLQGLGFDLTGLYPVSHDSVLRLVEMDCVMVNRHLIAPGAAG